MMTNQLKELINERNALAEKLENLQVSRHMKIIIKKEEKVHCRHKRHSK